MGVTIGEVAGSVERLTQQWREERTTRLARKRLERADFDLLRDADLLKVVAPVDAGGSWESMSSSLRELCGIYRQLGRVDPSVALVSSMHPAVVAFWLSTPDPTQPAWEEQRRAVFASAIAGEQWGTITSEPGSGGDITRTRSVATPADGVTFIAGRYLCSNRRQALRQRLGHHRPDDHDGDPRRAGRSRASSCSMSVTAPGTGRPACS